MLSILLWGTFYLFIRDNTALKHLARLLYYRSVLLDIGSNKYVDFDVIKYSHGSDEHERTFWHGSFILSWYMGSYIMFNVYICIIRSV